MAKLSVPQIQLRLRNKVRSSASRELALAIEHDAQTTFHTQPSLTSNELKYLPKFKEFVGRLLTPEKFSVFQHLLTLPLATVEITNGITDELQKVFEAQNRFVKFGFKNPELERDFDDYRQEIDDFMYWPTTGFNVMKSDVNSFMIVDLPMIQTSDRPEPYYYTITPDMVYDVDCDREGNIEFIIFNQGKHTFVFDEEAYRTFDRKGNLIAEAFHNLGYTPARTFWSTPYNNKSKILKQNVLTKSLSQLDWILYSGTAKKHLSTYAGFPIFIAFEQKCNFEDDEGNQCNNGRITRQVRISTSEDAFRSVSTDCPNCSESRKIMGAGTFLKAPAPRDSSEPNLLEGVKIIGGDTNSLDWMQKDVDSQISWVTYNVIGLPDEIASMAMNEKQIASQFESRINVLMNVKRNFEQIHRWTIETVAQLRYGDDFVEANVSYGDKFFMHTAEQIAKSYTDSKAGGAPMYELSSVRKQLYETKYKNNPEMRERMEMLSSIEPYPDLSLKELTELNEKIDIDDALIALKANFDNYVQRFERENIAMNLFMQFSPVDQRVSIIQSKLLQYVEEDMMEKEADPAEELRLKEEAAAAAAAAGAPPPIIEE